MVFSVIISIFTLQSGILMALNIKSDGKAPSMAEVLLDPPVAKLRISFSIKWI